MNTSSSRTGILRPASLLLGLLMANGGCAKLYHEFHYSPFGRQLAQHESTYYHSPHTGRIIPKDPCVQYGEPPCFGYESTCWQSWPSECVNCPPPPVTTSVSHVGQPVSPKSVVGEALPPSNATQPTPASSPTAVPPAMISVEPIDNVGSAPAAAGSVDATAAERRADVAAETPAASPAAVPPAAPPVDDVDGTQVVPPPVAPPAPGGAPGSSGVDFPNPNQGVKGPSHPFFEAPQSMSEPVQIPQPTLVDPAPERAEASHEDPTNVTDPPADDSRPERSSRRPTEHRLAGPTRVELPQIEALTQPHNTATSDPSATAVPPATAPTATAPAQAPPADDVAKTEQATTTEQVAHSAKPVEFPPALQESTASRLLRQAKSQSGAIPIGPTARVIHVEPRPSVATSSDGPNQKTEVVVTAPEAGTSPPAAVATIVEPQGEPQVETQAELPAEPQTVSAGAEAVAASHQMGKADIRFLGDSSPAVVRSTSAGPRLRLGGVPRQASRPSSLEVKFRN